ncbi:hypothetical protein QMK19_29155 [Streptomyces sp. H10-C2]|uniref:hypothetical protein n=1 Tax=unclassified Streptomyces TaxID=2593676 RepID=UPI0024BBE572|nr:MULTISPECIES: hypothetical protein [unclassified Streptomyces]MDJ0344188.1 hypothetical protein [Streptomyces sp. PH10-H1]MDJ0373618.1 hypothetical protein [Streptomyces sp. H10-C2]MDJ0383740.1 hypothetical protein [Streptomyces sp. G-G2]
MTARRELTRTQWTAFHSAYLRSNTAACPQCATLGETVLKPLDRVVRYACGHELALPPNTDPLTRPR